jgi:hypothetical protein
MASGAKGHQASQISESRVPIDRAHSPLELLSEGINQIQE